MSRDVIIFGSTMRISLLYRGEYSQWRERFMNYLEEQTDECTSYSQRPKVWTAKEKKTRKIDRLARSLLIQGLPNDIYSLIDSNETAKDLWDAIERQMRDSEYVINDLKKCGYKKDNCELNYKFLNNQQSEWKQYEFVNSNDKKEDKKADDKKRDMRKVECYNCKKEGNFAKDCKKAKVKDYK
nr:hypothetical protein [Tanacetum cinerariifolium]